MIDDTKEGMPLTIRQLDVLALVAQGFTNEQIGRILHLSPLTVKNHVQNILRKLGAYGRINAINVAMQKGLLECPNPDHPRCGHPIGITRSSEEPQPVLRSPRPDLVKPLVPSNDIPLEWVECGDLQLNFETFTLRIKSTVIKMYPRCCALLYYMLRHPGKIFSRQNLLNEIWGTGVFVEERTVDVHIRRLRVVLDANGYKDLITTIKPTGYGILNLPEKLP